MRGAALLLAVLGALVACGPPDPPDPGDDDDASAADDDDTSPTFLFEGTALHGTPDDSDEGTPMAGIVVADVHGGAETVSGDGGAFALEVRNDELIELRGHTDDEDYIDGIVAMTRGWLDLGEPLDVATPHLGHEWYHHDEYFDLEYLEEFGTVVCELLLPDDALPVGATVSISLPNAGSWVVLDDDAGTVATDTFPPDSDVGEMQFAHVEPGTAEVTISPPDGTTACDGPATITVAADALTLAQYWCE